MEGYEMKRQFNMNSTSTTITGLLLGFAMVFMVPISDSVLAKPNFGGSTLGKGCSSLWDDVMKLRGKKAAQGGTLNQKDATDLGNAESNYKSICAGIFGSLPLEVATSPDSPVVEENAVEDAPEEQQPGKVNDDVPQQEEHNNQDKDSGCKIGRWGIC
jgi:hypothetical protein